MKLALFVAFAIFNSTSSLALEKSDHPKEGSSQKADRRPAWGGGTKYIQDVKVEAIDGTALDVAERWTDSTNKVVCYATRYSSSGGSAASISCVKQ